MNDLYVTVFFLLISVVFVLPSLFLFIEVASACFTRKDFLLAPPEAKSYSTVIVIPAYNEANGISATLQSVASQLSANDKMMVIADNCTDNTAQVAREHGAIVIERQNLLARGKGFALAYAIDALRADPPEAIVFMDADSTIVKGNLAALATIAILSNRPTQAYYSMDSYTPTDPKQAIARLAWILKNHVRPRGCLSMGLPCQLMGTGMAFPWPLIAEIELGSSELVEDMKLGIDSALMGRPALFVPCIEVKSYFPLNQEGREIQSSRWESGHLSMMRRFVPKLLVQGISRFDTKLLALGLDLSIPPFVLYLLCHVIVLAIAVVLSLFSATAYPLAIVTSSTILLVVSICLTWLVFARDIIGASTIKALPGYFLAKALSYLRVFQKNKNGWVRTKRDSE
jgi:glycosyltransferase involved in cell wall biosynthesis